MSASVNGVAFGLLAFAAIGGAIGMLSSRNVVRAAFWMLEAMTALGGIFLLLSAEFVALAQLMVYAGAVSVLMLFVIMLTLRRREDAVRSLDLSVGAVVMAAVFGMVIYAGVLGYRPVPPPMPAEPPGVAALGEILFTHWMIPFELASVVLLVALVGAVWWAGGGDR